METRIIMPDDPNLPQELKEEMQKIIDENLDEILNVVKSKLSSSQEPDYRIINALKEYFK